MIRRHAVIVADPALRAVTTSEPVCGLAGRGVRGTATGGTRTTVTAGPGPVPGILAAVRPDHLETVDPDDLKAAVPDQHDEDDVHGVGPDRRAPLHGSGGGGVILP